MNFKEMIKQEWEKEFPYTEDGSEENLVPSFEESIFNKAFGSLVNNICTRVWNHVVTHSAAIGYNSDGVETEQAILKLRIDEQGIQ